MADQVADETLTVYDLVVIGGGPSGLAATSYALHAQLKVALVAPDLGGKVSYPFALRDVPTRDTVWGASLTHDFEQRVRESNVHIAATVSAIQPQENGDFDIELEGGTWLRSRALIMSTGARPQRLFVPGESDFWGKGLSYSAISHAPFFQDRKVAVIGSGDRAVNAVLALAQIASKVFFIVGRGVELESSPAWELALRHPKVLPFHDWEVQRIAGDDYVTALDLVGVNGEIRSLDVEGVFVQFGLLPNNSLVRSLVDLDREGHIVINERCATTLPGLFAAGDVTSVHAEQVPVSLGEGAKAAIGAWEYLVTRVD